MNTESELTELERLRGIVRDLCPPGRPPLKFIYHADVAEAHCCLCDSPLYSNLCAVHVHEQACPYRRAREWLAEVEGKQA